MSSMSTHTSHKCTRGRGARQHTSAYVSVWHLEQAVGREEQERERDPRKQGAELQQRAARSLCVRVSAASVSSASAASVSVRHRSDSGSASLSTHDTASAARRAQPVRQSVSSFCVSSVSSFCVSSFSVSSLCVSVSPPSAASVSVLFNKQTLLQCHCLLHHIRHTHALKAAVGDLQSDLQSSATRDTHTCSQSGSRRPAERPAEQRDT
jgi:hypothetical protein